MTRSIRWTATAWLFGALLGNGADSLYAQGIRPLNQPDLIEISGVSFDDPHSGHFGIITGHAQQLMLVLQNKTTNQGFSNLIATVRKIGGAGAYEVSWTIGGVPPPGTNLVIPPGRSTWGLPLAKPMWVPEPGEHKFEIIVDQANSLHEGARYVGNNRREITVATNPETPEMVEQAVNPSTVGPAGLLFVMNENDPSNLCEGTFEYSTNAVKAKLRYLGPRPAPNGFIACEARAEVYRNAKITNDWTIVSVSPTPPSSVPQGHWIMRPEGKSLHSQLLLRIPAEVVFYPNSSGLDEVNLVIRLRGPKGTAPPAFMVMSPFRIR